MKEKNLKGLVHAALAVAGLVEAFNSKTRVRKLLVGSMVGWHCHAAFYHFVLEKEKNSLDTEYEA